jgi:NAD(P)-dependent dehydrogenase (short-subunit alcohol dehydrogenase family)
LGLKERTKSAVRAFAGFASPARVPAPETTSVYDPELLRETTVLVTGPGPNIGRGLALEMGRHGARVVLVDVDVTNLRDAERELAEMGADFAGYLVDITDPAQIDAFCDQLAADSIRVDALINNIGIGDNAHRIADLDLAKWRALYDTNVFGPLHLTRRLITEMVEEGRTGSVLFITSMHQDVLSRNPSYSSSKAALGMIVKELAVELSDAGIRVNGLAPGWTHDPDTAKPGHSDYVLLSGGPIPPRYIGRAAVYLTADFFSAYTTGTVLSVDAGLGLVTYRTMQVPPG